MKKTRFLIVFGILVIAFIISVVIYQNHSSNNAIIKKDYGDSFRFSFHESFKGNSWNLYVNKNRIPVCSFSPSDGMSKKEMRDYFANSTTIDEVFVDANIRVYLVRWQEIGAYPIVYTVDGNSFFCWNTDVEKSSFDSDIENRLMELYTCISKEEMETKTL